MEPKKNPKYDVHRKRGMLFTVGLLTSLSIVIMAFEWKTEVIVMDNRVVDLVPDDHIYEVPSTDHVYNTPKPKPVIPRVATEYVEVAKDPAIDDELVEIDLPEVPVVQVIAPPAGVLPPEKVTNDITLFAEVMPKPADGFPAFYETLRNNMHYPTRARRLEIEGKVFVEFVVNEKGELSDVKIIRGIGAGCDEEAMRVLKLTRWEPGKQRGVPVKVRMVQPITFSLNK